MIKECNLQESIATLYPQLLSEWDYEKNTIKPTQVKPGSNMKVWWKCCRGHEWQTAVCHRAKKHGTNCPICKCISTSFPEQAVYYYVKNHFPKTVLHDRSRINKELDIYIPERDVAIEYDGGFWHTNKDAIRREKEKEKACKESGLQLIRIIENNNSIHDEDVICYYLENRKDLSDLGEAIEAILADLSVEKPIMI